MNKVARLHSDSSKELGMQPQSKQEVSSSIMLRPKWTTRLWKFMTCLFKGKVLPETGFKQLERFLLTIKEVSSTQRYILLYEDQIPGIPHHLCGWKWMSNPFWRSNVLDELLALDIVYDYQFDPPDELGRWTFMARSSRAVPKVSKLQLYEYTPD